MSEVVLPEGWAQCLLGDVVNYGKTEKIKIDDVELEDWILELEDIEKSSSKLLARVSVEERPFKSTKNIFQKGDVLYGKLRPYLNKVILADRNGICSTEIIPINAEPFIYNPYLFHWLKSGVFQAYVNSVSYGVNMPRLGTKDGNAAPLVLAPVAEQKEIAARLDNLLAQVDSIKTRLDAIPSILKRFRQSVLAVAVSGKLTEEWRKKNSSSSVSTQELLAEHRERWLREKREELVSKGKLPKTDSWKAKYKPPEPVEVEKLWISPSSWAWTTVDTIATVTKLAGFEFTKLVNYTDEGSVAVLKAENIGKDGFKVTNYSKVSADVVEALPRSELFGGEALIVFVGAGVGQVGLVPTDKKYFLGPNVAVVRNAANRYESKYFEFLIRSLLGKRNLLSFSKGAAQPSLSMGQIRKTSIPIPPYKEQTEIVCRVEQLFTFADQIEQRVKDAQTRVNNLTQSILVKAFRGELTADWREQYSELISAENSAQALLEKIKEQQAELTKASRKKRTKKS